MYKLELTEAEVNTILGVLSEAPFKIAAPLIEKIRGQALPQVPQPDVKNVGTPD